MQELQKAALRDARLRASEIYFTREFAHWSSPLHDARGQFDADGADQRNALAAGHRRGGAAARRAGAAAGERAIYLHEIQDPGNLGTILRTLAWFGNFRCLLSPDSVDVHNGKVVRASMGAIFHVPVEIDVPLDALAGALRADRLPRSAGRADRVAGSSATSTATSSATKRGACRARRWARCTRSRSRSPGRGAIESLNVAATREHLPVRTEPRGSAGAYTRMARMPRQCAGRRARDA